MWWGSFPKGAFSFALLHANAPQRGLRAGGDIDTQATFKGGCTDIAKVSAAFNPLWLYSCKGHLWFSKWRRRWWWRKPWETLENGLRESPVQDHDSPMKHRFPSVPGKLRLLVSFCQNKPGRKAAAGNQTPEVENTLWLIYLQLIDGKSASC